MKSDKSPKIKSGMPWWSSVFLAIGSYLFFKYTAPSFNPQHPVLRELCEASPTFAPIITIPFLLLAAKQLYDRDTIGTDNQEHADDFEDKSDE